MAYTPGIPAVRFITSSLWVLGISAGFTTKHSMPGCLNSRCIQYPNLPHSWAHTYSAGHKIARGKDSDITLARIKEPQLKTVEIIKYIEGQCSPLIETA